MLALLYSTQYCPCKPTHMHAETLLDRMHGRDNNLNLLRMAAATMVLVSHSFALTTGPKGYEPWRETYGTTPGAVAVEIFFIVSGMLLTFSLLQRRSTWGFIRARALRIYPGLLVAVALTVFVLGPIFTTLDLASYFQNRTTWKHLITNGLAFMNLEFTLPGVFQNNVWPSAVNGSLWTLRSELTAYAVLLAAWVLSSLIGGAKVFRAATVLIFIGCLGWRVVHLGSEPLENDVMRLFLAFFAGGAMCIFGHRIRLWTWLFGLAVGAVLVGVFVPSIFPWTYTISLPFIVAWLAYVPEGAMRNYNRLGDYSYGTYIYAFPMQQILAHLVPGISAIGMMAGAMLLTLLFAVASWHLIEKPASRWRGFSSEPRKSQPEALRA